ncbi:tRNA pseudouridine(55) synthase TruB [Ornithinibacillus halophilus]|uniref:tRNA pseudouridine synthase B n=1 Tax=Ornithinibacillus halophilus TaxID=930117 RepID=A0A1M5CCY3_9BACI|nr:tRNA pseudouridine(55) synthase TruB [Ornithinibacillus halophilus]SHF52598.1 tRNA pseudouridine synthase B [Ornithinibacillus halophilus]
MNGILPLWKPRGMTSHDCVVKIRRLYKTKKVGHTGTLDPEVEGVLPICIGQATKIVPFLTDTKKTYIGEVTLGKSTTTEDDQGESVELKQVDKVFSKQEIENVLKSFEGTITQIPPMYSAVKVNGKKLYEYARNNETVERPKREVTIYDLMLLSLDSEQHRVKLQVVCSKGTYIRTLCVDIGKKLGFPAHMSDLIRTQTGSIEKEDTFDFRTIEKAVENGKEKDLLLPLVRGIDHLDILSVDEATKNRVIVGQKLERPNKVFTTDPFVVMYEQQLLAIYQIHPEKPNQIKPVRVFNT